MIDIQILETALDPEFCRSRVEDDAAGGLVVFTGTVREQTQNRKVTHLEFESYVPMAVKEMKKIAEEADKRWNTIHICIHHRVGTLEVGEIPVVIAVSTPHRKAAFEACEYCIDQLKETVPIWKKEFFEGGEVWVAAHP
jgi:molybdopterin synthase catalytic subunit